MKQIKKMLLGMAILLFGAVIGIGETTDSSTSLGICWVVGLVGLLVVLTGYFSKTNK